MENTNEDVRAEAAENEISGNFIHDIIDEDLRLDPELKIHTRFPPEPNGYLHIGSAKAIRINYQIARKYHGLFNLRYDDTNPVREGDEYVQSIYEDLKWLGCEPNGGVFYGSDYFDKCYEFAVKLIRDGKAYVDDLSAEQMKEYRGTLTEPGRESPFRNRSVEENLELFERMKNGEFPDGSHTLRAKIDMSSPNMNMRDPAIYRILHTDHHRQGNKWCIYPLYDYAHPIQDALEGITHSCCSLEFENHRPLYEWVVDNIGFDPKPKQREFARLNVTHTVMSKRYLRQLVETGLVDGWDDPRMPTLCGLRRRGYTPSAIFDFVDRAGVSKAYSVVDIELLEHCIREELNATAPRRIAVMKPLKLIIDNYPEEKTEYFELPNNPQAPDAGTRPLPFTRELYIDADDFAELPPPKFFRLKPEGEVRLMGAYIVKCVSVEHNADGSVAAVHCTADLETGNGNPADGRKVKGTIHWLSAEYARRADVMLYDYLFTLENIDDMPEGKTYGDYLNPNSVTKLEGCMIEPSLADAAPGERFQFVRNGYYVKDTKNADTFNRIVGLKDSYPKKK
ncbi:MAG: glutamine--tRNA ligase/YqeY domain fusion protein [Eubacteriales bacterium]|nr:glutamine--tRNA ligase/YqeY domain fusion protein [Eubacteriales bacterium]